jgi:hypothetical protein
VEAKQTRRPAPVPADALEDREHVLALEFLTGASRRGSPVSSASRDVVSGIARSKGRSWSCRTGPRASTIERWMMFSISRTFPGQS